MKNQNSVNAAALILLVLLLGSSSGCAALCGVTDECGLNCGDGCQCHNCEPGCGYSEANCSDYGCGCPGNGRCRCCPGLGRCPLAFGRHHKRIEVGPPAVRYRPEMPPEFLPVPVTPVLVNVDPNAPPEMRGAVEVDWAPPCQLTVYGRD